jgi:hypothetical protein
VLITIVKDDGNWWAGIKDLLLDNCSVVDEFNWKCRETNGKPEGPFYVVNDYAMVHGRYYHSLTGGGPPEFYTSSISGRTFLKLYYRFFTDAPAALRETGYPAQAVEEARLRCLREYTAARSNEDWCVH